MNSEKWLLQKRSKTLRSFFFPFRSLKKWPLQKIAIFFFPKQKLPLILFKKIQKKNIWPLLFLPLGLCDSNVYEQRDQKVFGDL